MDPINILYPSHVSINIPAPLGSVMGYSFHPFFFPMDVGKPKTPHAVSPRPRIQTDGRGAAEFVGTHLQWPRQGPFHRAQGLHHRYLCARRGLARACLQGAVFWGAVEGRRNGTSEITIVYLPTFWPFMG